MFNRISFYLRLLAVYLWSGALCVIFLAVSPLYLGSYRLNHDFSHSLSWLALRIFGWKLHVSGKEHLKNHVRKPAIYVANHQSYMDFFTFGSIYPNSTVVIGKKELIFLPFFGFLFWAAGNILLDRKNRNKAVNSLKQVEEAILKKHIGVWIFPEGTRNRGKCYLLPFKKGAFHLSAETNSPIVPLVCEPLLNFFDLKKHWMRKGPVRIKILTPMLREAHETTDDFMARVYLTMHTTLEKDFN